MEHILDILKERGFIAQMTFEDELYEQLTVFILVIISRSWLWLICNAQVINRLL